MSELDKWFGEPVETKTVVPQRKVPKKDLLDVAKETEKAVKYILCKSSLFGAVLSKDGDWVTYARGQEVFQKKVSDYMGGVKVPGYSEKRLHLYVEVKGVSPEKDFALARLDRPNNPKQKSQHEKLTKAYEDGSIVWLAMGWWLPLHDATPVIETKKGRTYTQWVKNELTFMLYLIDWGMWLEKVLPMLGERRTFKDGDRAFIQDCAIWKQHSWRLHSEHWWYRYADHLHGLRGGSWL